MQFRIHGMDCAEEVAVLKREVGNVVGGEANLSFDILNGKMAVDTKTNAMADVVIEAVARTGMRAVLWQNEKSTTGTGHYWERNRRTILTAAGGVLLVIAAITHTSTLGFSKAFGFAEIKLDTPWTVRFLYALSILASVWTVLPKAWFAAKRLRPDMNLLMVVAVSGAVALGEWLEAASVAFLFALSLALEAWSVGRARRAVAALMDLSPPTVRLLDDDGRETLMPPDEVPVGARFLVRPGDRVPLDGQVVEGTGGVDQAPITGESIPVQKGTGDEVFAGTINGEGLLTVKSTKPASDTTLARITRLVGEAQSRRSPSEQWVERFARIYTPSVMMFALAILLIPPVFFGNEWGEWIYRSLVLLVIACPCALVISTPVTIVAALAAAARNGVLVKGGVYIETPSRLKAIAFDKTGTLTEGKPAVVEVAPFGSVTETELLEIAGSLESRSTHPLAQAIVAEATKRKVSMRPAENFRILPGKGAEGRIGDTVYWLGSHRFLEERGQETPAVHERIESITQAGRSVVVIGTESNVLGFIALADRVRPNSKDVLTALRASGIDHIVMLTGDNRGTAVSIADQVGVDEVHAELLPADKVTKVEALVAKYGAVAMLGDGVNDAPALARSTLGIAMGAAGSDAAIETADVALMADDLSKLPWLIRHSRRTMSVIRQNIAFSLGVKAVFVILTFSGYSSMWGAIAADMGASLLVVFNGLRLLVPIPMKK